ncbi:unnamed protein product [Mytilus edulis]|uniref:Uncharacterized protein n=1 Tax=Mytilus edulis TaxID=6550 RepID=A0A8S3RWU6_MYTED|nr:unnamed protein product [Mytilus edulis]
MAEKICKEATRGGESAEGFADSAVQRCLQNIKVTIDCKVREHILNALTADNSWDFKMVEWKNRKSDGTAASYGMIAFGKSPNQQFVDVILALYNMDYVLDGRAEVKTREQAWFHPYSSDEDVSLTFGSIQNFFRVKALEECKSRGFIKSVEYVKSLNDIPESPNK